MDSNTNGHEFNNFICSKAKDPDDEYVRLKADKACNTKGYAVVDRTFDDKEKVSDEFRHIYVFPSIDLAEGDYVHLFTGSGKYKTVINNGKTLNHRLYWGSDECVWNDNGKDKASLITYLVKGTVEVPAVE